MERLRLLEMIPQISSQMDLRDIGKWMSRQEMLPTTPATITHYLIMRIQFSLWVNLITGFSLAPAPHNIFHLLLHIILMELSHQPQTRTRCGIRIAWRSTETLTTVQPLLMQVAVQMLYGLKEQTPLLQETQF